MKLKIKRKHDALNQMWPFRVYLDEKLLGEVKHNETVEFFVGPGEHEIYLEVNDYFTKTLNFVMKDDLILECGTEKAKKILGLFYTYRPEERVYIKEVGR